MKAAELAKSRPAIQPERADVVVLYLEMHPLGLVLASPSGQRCEHAAARAGAACLRSRCHAEYARPAGVGDRTAHRYHGIADQDAGVSSRQRHPAERPRLGPRVTAVAVHRMPDLEPLTCWPFVHQHPADALLARIRTTFG